MTSVHAYAVKEQGAALTPFEFQLPELGFEQVDIAVEYCGICHSDLSMLLNEWDVSQYPLVPGHEIVGKIVAAGEHVKGVKVGDRVGLGWFSESCMHCHHCMAGDHNLCVAYEQTIVGRHGGFADRVRCHWGWAVPLPGDLDVAKAGPLFCGGITVFNPIVQFGVKPTDRVGVIGIGGLGHLAVQFLNKWGCEVTAFTSSAEKAEEARRLGAHNVLDSRDDSELEKAQGSLNFIINTTNVNLNWEAYASMLAPKGRLHTVGAVPDPIALQVFPMLVGQKSLSASPLGSPATILDMLVFCSRHNITPITELYKMSDVNLAMQHLRDGEAHYRVVLENDF